MTGSGIKKRMKLDVFKWNDGIPIRFMRIETYRLYAFDCQRHNELYFKAVLKGGHRGSAQMLKSWRAKHKYAQSTAAGKLHVSQPAIAKYETGGKTMPLGVALKIEDINNGRLLDEARYAGLMEEKIFKFKKHIAMVRIEVGEKHYCCYTHRRNKLVFKVVPKPEPDYETGKLLKEVRQKNKWSQEALGYLLGVKQSTVAKFESGDRIPTGWRAGMVSQLIRGSTIEQVVLVWAYRNYERRRGASSVTLKQVDTLAKLKLDEFQRLFGNARKKR